MKEADSLERLVTITSPSGLHARPAAQLARMASRFRAILTLERLTPPPAAPGEDAPENEEADCRSIMSLLMLAAGQGTCLRLRAEGRDAANALRSVGDFFESGFNGADAKEG